MLLDSSHPFPRRGDASGRKPVITIIGAASTTFGPKVLRDVINHPALHGSTLRLVDVNAERLETYVRLARRVSASLPRPCTVESSTDRRALLPGSDVVVLSVDRGHYNTWRLDFELPVAEGIRQIYGELGGPGGLFHALRQIPLHLAFARDIEELCPKALVLVSSNPLHRICQALRDHSEIGPVIGLCHGVEMLTQLVLPKLMNLSGDDLVPTAAGTNHLTWLLDLRHREDGRDLLPAMREAFATADPKLMPLTRKILDVFGYAPATLDSHCGEYIAWAWDVCGPVNPNFSAHLEQEHKRWDYLAALANDEAKWDELKQHLGSQEELSEELRLDPMFAPRSWADTLVFPLIDSLHTGALRRLPAIDLPNEGAIDNLPLGAYVETPATIDASGVHPLAVGSLPSALAAFNCRDLEVQELCVAAAVSGDRKLLLQALLLDPVVDSVAKAEKTMNALLAAQAEYLPQFQ